MTAKTKHNILDFLIQRGLIYQMSDEPALRIALDNQLVLYEGFDPTAKSFHLGHMIPLMFLHHMQEAGHKVIFLLGGGTGRVGDPSGKSSQRNMLTSEQVKENAASLQAQVEKIGLLRFSGENAAIMVNNADWLSKFSFLEDFMTEIAPYFSVNDMVGMRTFAERLEKSKPLSVFEFLYPAMQAWDYLWLFQKYDCTLQVGGQDQLANILAGVDLVRKATQKKVFALTFPLLVTASGQKMGKSENGALWLDAQMTSPFEFYQYLISTPDELVPSMLKILTPLTLEEIDKTILDKKEAQKLLAFEITKLVHGEKAAKEARDGSSIPTIPLPKNGFTITEALVNSNCLSSNSEARRRVEQGGVTVDDQKVNDPKYLVQKPSTIKYGKGAFLKVI